MSNNFLNAIREAGENWLKATLVKATTEETWTSVDLDTSGLPIFFIIRTYVHRKTEWTDTPVSSK